MKETENEKPNMLRRNGRQSRVHGVSPGGGREFAVGRI